MPIVRPDGPLNVLMSQLPATWDSIDALSGGDVVGPASAINDRIAVFDSTTGKVIKDGGSTIADIVAGVGGAPLSATYITQTPNATLTNEQALSTLATGLLKNTTTTGVLSIAAPGTDYLTPTGNGSGLTNLSGSSLTDNSVSLAKLADIATGSFLGRNTVATGDPEVLSIATAKAMLSLTGTNTGDVTLAGQDYLTIADQVITANAINLSGTHVTSTLPVTKGGTGTATQFTPGSVVFAGASGVYSQDNASLFWDDATNRLGIGTAGPTQTLEVAGNVFINSATANLYLKDTSTGLQSATTTVITPQANNSLRSIDFTSGLVGWNWSAAGNAEANNIDIRGSIRASIFTFNSVNATAGTLGVFKSAAKLRSDVVVPAAPTYGTTTVNIDVVDPEGLAHASAQIFAGNDIIQLKSAFGTSVGSTWLKVNASSDQTTFWRYSAIIMAGSNNVTYRAGLGVANYGPSNQGFIIQTADQTNSPYLQMATHASNFTSSDAAGSLIVTPRLRIGNLNGSYGYATDIYGFGTGQYGTAGQSWVTVDATNGVRLGNFTTTRLHLAADGSGFVANGNIAWTTAGVASISGWTINATSISNGTTYLASGLDIPAGQVAWFGRQTDSSQGFMLRDSAGRFIDSLVGFGAIYPFIAINDGTRFRIALGGLNFAYGSDGSTDSMGMKVWSSAGAKLVEFSDVQNIIAGWSIAATKISSTGIDIHSGASAALAFGTTPPTSAAAGTGIWLDRTGLYGLASDVVQIKIDATGKLLAGGSKVLLDSRGLNIQQHEALADAYSEASAVNFREVNALVSALYHNINTASLDSRLVLECVPQASFSSRIELRSRAATSQTGQILLFVQDNNGGASAGSLITSTLFTIGSKLTISSDSFNVSTAKTPASASATGTTGDIAWDSGFLYCCTATNTWKRVAIATW